MASSQVPAEDIPNPWYLGHHESQRTTADAIVQIETQTNLEYNFVTAPLTNEQFRTRVCEEFKVHVRKIPQDSTNRQKAIPKFLISPLMPAETDCRPDDKNPASRRNDGSLLGMVSPWIELGHPDPLIAEVSRQVLNLELGYASFCGIQNVIVHAPRTGSSLMQYSRAILESLILSESVSLHVLLPQSGELLEAKAVDAPLSKIVGKSHLSAISPREPLPSEASELDPCGGWKTWDTIRSVCNYFHRLYVALEVHVDAPHPNLWFSEPVRIVFIPQETFLRNARGKPVLAPQTKLDLAQMMNNKHAPVIVLANVDPIITAYYPDIPREDGSLGPTPAEAAAAAASATQEPMGSLPHLNYIRHLATKQPARPLIERYGYEDTLQPPLQPLVDHLDSITYEVFERDPVKYEWYEKAIRSALRDTRQKIGELRKPVVAVVGAGRGPLVSRALLASRAVKIDIWCVALEKNPNAHVLLHSRNTTDPIWNNQVMIYKADMRRWKGPTINGEIRKVDILISELLGSFGDNELSPECLDGVQDVLAPGGINIPQKYDAYVTPIATPRLYQNLIHGHERHHWNKPYVVLLQQFDHLCMRNEKTPDVKEAWSFSHPIPTAVLEQSRTRKNGTTGVGGWTGGDGDNDHNARSCQLRFTASRTGVCHGLAGYFETVLYSGSDGKPIELSTNPATMERKSKDMISWFPIFFPLMRPLLCPSGSEIEVSMWRQSDNAKVWYEWLVQVFSQTPGGERIEIERTELRSSRDSGYLR